ncbi:hypothetical protein SAMN02787081_03717 [Lysinibacillus fusiformis]|uniref:Uncharacterized protein n=1 Tax=Lysinibacillus fusiformis TaxID=28031 RepID=A0A1H9NFJ0_9BACI|nr:hypothetical protein SAMN02787081_03717 [Lysinibacillus fusiformis]SER34744.1 hypothetical protein SAMN02787113_03568 [Lysinibacillus fusiformis]
MTKAIENELLDSFCLQSGVINTLITFFYLFLYTGIREWG